MRPRPSTLLRAVSFIVRAPLLTWRQRGGALRDLLAGRAAIPLRQGTLSFDVAHDADWRVFRGIFVRRDYGADYRDGVVVDIGAHRGFFSAYVLHEGCAAVLAYEPEPTNFDYLRRNLASVARPDQEARAYPYAVHVAPGTARFFVYDQSWSHSTIERTDRVPVAELSVDQVDFADILAEAIALAGEHRRLIVKIDAEGVEYDLLLQTPMALLTRIDELFVETHAYAAGETPAVVERLARGGLVCTERAQLAGGRYEVLHVVNAER